MNTQAQEGKPAETRGGIHIPSLHIENFRGIRKLSMAELRQTTVITGRSGSGRTTLLDAAEIHATRGAHPALRGMLLRADEVVLDDETGRTVPAREALFSGRDISLEIRIRNGDPDRDIRMTASEDQDALSSTATIVTVRAGEINKQVDLAAENEWRSLMQLPDGHPFRGIPCARLGPEPAPNRQVAELWDHSVLNGEEPQLVEVLREATGGRIERIACIGDAPHRRGIARTKGSSHPVPLRSLGTGATQTAALIMAFQKARDGLLLLDQPETGMDPDALNAITSWILREAPARNTQVMIITNSPALVESAERTDRESPSRGMLPVLLTRMPV